MILYLIVVDSPFIAKKFLILYEGLVQVADLLLDVGMSEVQKKINPEGFYAGRLLRCEFIKGAN